MTQDQYGQAPRTEYVRGEVVADDDTDEFPAGQAAPATPFQKVASALRGDRSDPSAADPPAPDPNGSWPSRPAEAGTAAGTGPADAAADPDRTRSGEVGAVRSPDAADGEYPDGEDDTGLAATPPGEEAGQTQPAGPDTRDPATTEPDLYGTTTHGDAGQTPAPATGTGTTPDHRDHADAAASPHRVTAPAAVSSGAAGKQAGVPAEPELRPGETQAPPGDLSDLAYGSLLPDASEFRQRWHQVQFRFVDDPPGSVTEAADVVAQVTAKLEAAIAERQRSLRARWSEGTSGDTETLRATLLMYRAFLDQLTGPGS